MAVWAASWRKAWHPLGLCGWRLQCYWWVFTLCSWSRSCDMACFALTKPQRHIEYQLGGKDSIPKFIPKSHFIENAGKKGHRAHLLLSTSLYDRIQTSLYAGKVSVCWIFIVPHMCKVQRRRRFSLPLLAFDSLELSSDSNLTATDRQQAISLFLMFLSKAWNLKHITSQDNFTSLWKMRMWGW